MPAERLSMRKVREVLRLKHTLGMSLRQISEATGVGKTVVGEYVRRAGVIGMTGRGAEETLFVDYAGDTVLVFDQSTGAQRPAHIFVAVLGASNYTYAEARWSEGLADWIAAHVNTFAVIGGVPKAVVCDNLKAGVTKPSRYEPGINRSYQHLAEPYASPFPPAPV